VKEEFNGKKRKIKEKVEAKYVRKPTCSAA